MTKLAVFDLCVDNVYTSVTIMLKGQRNIFQRDKQNFKNLGFPMHSKTEHHTKISLNS